jgi:hypothetical protein
VQDVFTIDYAFTNTQIEVIDMSGKVLQLTAASAGAASARFNVSALPAGNYRIQIIDGKKIVSGNFLKK